MAFLCLNDFDKLQTPIRLYSSHILCACIWVGLRQSQKVVLYSRGTDKVLDLRRAPV